MAKCLRLLETNKFMDKTIRRAAFDKTRPLKNPFFLAHMDIMRGFLPLWFGGKNKTLAPTKRSLNKKNSSIGANH